MGGAEKTIGVIFQAKNRSTLFSTVGADTLEATQAVVQGVGQHVSFGFPPGNHFTIQPDQAIDRKSVV